MAICRVTNNCFAGYSESGTSQFQIIRYMHKYLKTLDFKRRETFQYVCANKLIWKTAACKVLAVVLGPIIDSIIVLKTPVLPSPFIK